jgi:DtxR family Mn-dependent transcriptional regulator
MQVSPASATNMVKRLAELHLVEYTPYQSVTLTAAGEQIALEVLRHHRLLELYLHQALNIPWDQVHEEADKLEHVLSESVEDAMAQALGNPTIDPHGDPIPTKAGHVTPTEGISLNDVTEGEPHQLVRVLIQDPARLQYLGTLGLYPNAIVTVQERAPFHGPLELEVDGQRRALAYDMAQTLIVRQLDA